MKRRKMVVVADSKEQAYHHITEVMGIRCMRIWEFVPRGGKIPSGCFVVNVGRNFPVVRRRKKRVSVLAEIFEE